MTTFVLGWMVVVDTYTWFDWLMYRPTFCQVVDAVPLAARVSLEYTFFPVADVPYLVEKLVFELVCQFVSMTRDCAGLYPNGAWSGIANQSPAAPAGMVNEADVNTCERPVKNVEPLNVVDAVCPMYTLNTPRVFVAEALVCMKYRVSMVPATAPERSAPVYRSWVFRPEVLPRWNVLPVVPEPTFDAFGWAASGRTAASRRIAVIQSRTGTGVRDFLIVGLLPEVNG
jgi:hypothetical protein